METFKDKILYDLVVRTSANYVIGATALRNAHMSEADYQDAIDHLTNNTIQIVSVLYGIEGVNIYTSIKDSYLKNEISYGM